MNSENERLERIKFEIDRSEVEREIAEFERLINRMFENVNDNETENQNENNNEDVLPKTPTLVIVTSNYDGEEYNHLDIKKGEFLIVTDWTIKKGWVYGHRKDNEEENGIFPEVFIEIYEEESKGNTLH